MTSYKTYRCHACGRRLSKATYTSPEGWVLGPVCAEKSSALPGVPPKPRAAPRARVLPSHAAKTRRRKRAARAKKQRHAARAKVRRLAAQVLPGQLVLDLVGGWMA